MTNRTIYRGLALASSEQLQDDRLEQGMASPAFERLLSDVVDEEEGEEDAERWDGQS